MNERKWYGWIIVEPGGEGFKDFIYVEWMENDVRRKQEMPNRGESGAAQAVEWWDRKVGQSIRLEHFGSIGYRVYTEVS
jgi:hypothetical protein